MLHITSWLHSVGALSYSFLFIKGFIFWIKKRKNYAFTCNKKVLAFLMSCKPFKHFCFEDEDRVVNRYRRLCVNFKEIFVIASIGDAKLFFLFWLKNSQVFQLNKNFYTVFNQFSLWSLTHIKNWDRHRFGGSTLFIFC